MERGQQTNCQRTNLKPNPVEFAPGHSKCLALVRFDPKYVHKLLLNVIEELLSHNTCQHMNMQLDRETRINYLYQLVTVR